MLIYGIPWGLVLSEKQHARNKSRTQMKCFRSLSLTVPIEPMQIAESFRDVTKAEWKFSNDDWARLQLLVQFSTKILRSDGSLALTGKRGCDSQNDEMHNSAAATSASKSRTKMFPSTLIRSFKQLHVEKFSIGKKKFIILFGLRTDYFVLMCDYEIDKEHNLKQLLSWCKVYCTID